MCKLVEALSPNLQYTASSQQQPGRFMTGSARQPRQHWLLLAADLMLGKQPVLFCLIGCTWFRALGHMHHVHDRLVLRCGATHRPCATRGQATNMLCSGRVIANAGVALQNKTAADPTSLCAALQADPITKRRHHPATAQALYYSYWLGWMMSSIFNIILHTCAQQQQQRAATGMLVSPAG